jgi:hypothetical protein
MERAHVSDQCHVVVTADTDVSDSANDIGREDDRHPDKDVARFHAARCGVVVHGPIIHGGITITTPNQTFL